MAIKETSISVHCLKLFMKLALKTILHLYLHIFKTYVYKDK